MKLLNIKRITPKIKKMGRFLFPTECLHCRNLLDQDTSYFCSDCFSRLELLDQSKRCQYCFDLLKGSQCVNCFSKGAKSIKAQSVFEYDEISKSMLYAFKFYGKYPLAKLLASFMVLQWEYLENDLPDLVVSVPIHSKSFLIRGYNQSALLSDELSKIWGIPHKLPARRVDYGLPQRMLNLIERREQIAHYQWIFREQIYGKNILIIDDVISTGRTVSTFADFLWEGSPKSIEAFSLCRTSSRAS